MPKTFSINDAMTASEIVTQNPDLANHVLNAFTVPTEVSVYAAANSADIVLTNFQIGAEVHAKDLTLPVATAVSMRDHLIAQGIAMPGSRLGVAYQNTLAGANTFRSIWVLKELA